MDYDPDNARDPQYDDEQFDDGVDEERTLFGRVNFVGECLMLFPPRWPPSS